MTTLDVRGHQAAAAIHRSVAEFAPTVSAAGVARLVTVHRALNFAGAVAVVALAVVIGAWLRTATDTDGVADTVPPRITSTTVVPEIEIEQPDMVVPTDPELDPVVPPVVVGGDDGGTVEEEPPPQSEETPVEEEPPPAEEPDTEPPFIEITSPADGAVFDEKVIRFEGETEPVP